jgi:putative flavoprotein involved in K+ transport
MTTTSTVHIVGPEGRRVNPTTAGTGERLRQEFAKVERSWNDRGEHMGGAREPERFDTIVVGGGQSGLVVGYHLAQRGIPFVILDASKRIGDAWRNRWDSLRLFSPNFWNHLPGMPFPGPKYEFATKDQTADYLEAYAAKFELPVRSGVRVDKLSKVGDRFVLRSGDRVFEANNVVVAMGSYQVPRVPPFASELDPGIVQMHSFQYRNPSQLKDGDVLVVGAANSGAEISLDTSKGGHRTWLSGRHPGHVPINIHGLVARLFFLRLVRFVGHHVLTVTKAPGRKMRNKLLSQGAPLVGTKPKDIDAAGVKRVPRVVGVRDGLPLLEDQQVLEVANVIWATGFGPGFSWIDLPVFGENEQPMHDRGIVAKVPGLYFVGLLYIYAMSSAFLLGVGRDSAYVVEHLASRTRKELPRAQQPSECRHATRA